MKNILRILIVAVMISSCHQKQSDSVMYDMAGVEEEMIPITRKSPPPPPLPIDNIEKQKVIKKKIIKDGRIGIQVSELKNTKLRIDTLIKTYEGYYSKESLNNTDWESSYSLKIRIPSANFEDFITHIESGDGEILYKEIDARDVTDQFIDLETRLENKKSYLKRYKDLLNRAKSIKEILEIEEKIRGLEEEIESTTGRLKYLGDLVNFSTLDLTISKQKTYKHNPQKRDKFSEKLKSSLSKGWYGFVDFFLFIIKVWPFWIIVSLIFYAWKKFKKKKRSKN
jgi:hypothetical protein